MSGTGNIAIAVPAAFASAASFGLGAAVQHRQARSARTAGKPGVGPARLLARLARQPLWLAGIALAVAGYGLQAAALAFGPLTLVAPIVATDLIFALPLAAKWSGRPLTSRDWAGCALTAGGVAAFLVTAPESSGRSDAPVGVWLLAFGAVTLACLAVTAGGRRGGPAARAATAAVAAGLIYGLTAAVTLSLTRLGRSHGLWQVLAHWQPWVLIGLGLSGLALTMGAFQAGALGASLPVIDTVEPVAGVLIGTLVFGERMAASPGGLGIQAVGAAAAVAGILLLGAAARATDAAVAVGAGRRDEDAGGSGSGTVVGHRSEEKILTRSRSGGAAAGHSCGAGS